MTSRTRELLDCGWLFHLEQKSGPDGLLWAKTGDWNRSGKGVPTEYDHLFFSGPAAIDYDDSQWRPLDLPHDWTIEQPVSPAAPLQNGFLPGGIGWYRKHFTVPAADLGGKLWLEFDGIFRDASVWVNGHLVGLNHSGYIGFACDISDVVEYGAANVIVVRVNATKKEGWWYEGAGIYRHVWLTRAAATYLTPAEIFVTTGLRGPAGCDGATLTVAAEARNDTDKPTEAEVLFSVVAPDGCTIAEAHATCALDPGGVAGIRQTIDVAHPVLWWTDAPALYQLVTRLFVDGAEVDRVETTFGIRSARFDPDQGFLLNDRPLKLKGVCAHQSFVGVGSAIPDALHEYRLREMKAVGANAHRSHFALSPVVLDLCDRLGILILEETRLMGASAEAYGQMERMVRRDRNHPSVVLWSLANEEMVIQGTPVGARMWSAMRRRLRTLDPTRPVTAGMNRQFFDGFATVVDVIGLNYQDPFAFRSRFPDKPVIYTEAGTASSTRGIYTDDAERCYLSGQSYAPYWGQPRAEEFWRRVADTPWLAGLFIWTIFDYRGEPSPYKRWPATGAHFGIMDDCGFPKDSYYYYKANWTAEPLVHVFPHWNWTERADPHVPVWCYSNCERVELFLNGRSLGVRDVPRAGHAEWCVYYEPGRLEARGMIGDQVVAVDAVETSGPAAALRLEANRVQLAAGGDVAVVTVRVVDGQGRTVPQADPDLLFAVAGAGRILGLGNGDPASHEPEKGCRRRAFNGLARVLVQTGEEAGELTLSAAAAGLAPAQLTLTAAR